MSRYVATIMLVNLSVSTHVLQLRLLARRHLTSWSDFLDTIDAFALLGSFVFHIILLNRDEASVNI